MVGSEPCIGSELLDVMPGSKETTSVGREGLEDGRSTREDFCPGQFRKGALWGPGEGPRENIYWKILRVSPGASDFSSQRQKWWWWWWGESFEGPCLPIVLMPFDGRGKSNSTCLRIKSGPSNADSSRGCLSLHSCNKAFLKYLGSALNLNCIGRCCICFLLDDNRTTVSCCFLDNEA